MRILRRIWLLNCILSVYLLTKCFFYVFLLAQKGDINHDELRTKIIISTTYNQKSRQAITLYVGRRYVNYRYRCRSRNSTDELISVATTINAVKHVSFQCLWTQYVAFCDVVDNMHTLEIDTASTNTATTFMMTLTPSQLSVTPIDEKNSNSFHLIPYRYAETRRRNVVVCVTPLFYYDRWQMLVTAIEMWRYYGVDEVAIYLNQAIETIYRILRAYERQGIVAVRPWADLPILDDEFNPLAELEWRNQPAGLTDCLYLYRESAEFIMFADADDILTPRMDRYIDEFRFLLDRWPYASSFLYNRWDVTILHDSIAQPMHRFRLNETLARIQPTKVQQCVDDPSKKYVTIPKRIYGAWLHRTGHVIAPYRDYVVPADENCSRHYRKWINISENSMGDYRFGSVPPAIPLMDANRMQLNYEHMIENEQLTYLIPNDGEFYIKAMEQCYDVLHPWSRCEGHVYCRIPQFEVFCTVSRSTYDTFIGANGRRTVLITSSEFEHRPHGCDVDSSGDDARLS